MAELAQINFPSQVPSTSHDGIGLYQCKDGYVLKGPNTTKCHFGNWTEVTPSCELVYCPFPGYIDKGKVSGDLLHDRRRKYYRNLLVISVFLQRGKESDERLAGGHWKNNPMTRVSSYFVFSPLFPPSLFAMKTSPRSNLSL